ncbi:hypothetical protein M0R04_07300 [Candidatus Dojkabacteria bacterium]|jgi:hypothetical protein|nr:hypothetical protein [Candidatus Dojkabacteria bacterium]
MKSTLFLSNLSIIDHAYVSDTGQVIGGSYNPNFLVSGEVSSDESVVVDFSTIKHDLKFHIDKHIFDVETNGFDHKLWIIEGYSKCNFTEAESVVTIGTPAFSGTVPADAIRYIKNPKDLKFSDDFIGDAIANHLTECLRPQYPDVNIEVKCINTTDAHVCDPDLPISFFRYSHGLKDSSSYGCNNIFHGHLSFISYEDQDTCDYIASELHNAVFINPENIVYEDDEIITISYTTPKRGFFGATYKKDLNKIIILATETTVEYIANYVNYRFGLFSPFYISEGLSKGVYMQ